MDKGKLTKDEKIGIKGFDAQSRTLNVNKQVIISFFLKGLMMALTLIQVPLTIAVLGKEEYGVWQTILSVTSWLGIMDIGIGNGLRNKLTEAIATEDYKSGKSYISTSYIFLFFLILILFLLFLLIAPFFDWNNILNTRLIDSKTLWTIVTVLVFYTLIFFILNLINQILNALQKNSLSAIPNIIANLLFVVVLYFFPNAFQKDILSVTWLYVGTMVLSFVLFSIFVFYKNPIFTPSVKTFDLQKIKHITTLGFSFFLIQIAVVVIFSTDNLIISHVLGAAEVTPYSITLRVFNSFGMFVGLVMAPLWSAYTEAFVKKDYVWIRQRIRTLNLLMIPLAIGVGLIILFFDTILAVWLKSNVGVPALLPTLMGIYTLISVWNNIYAYFLNGISRLKEQLVTAVIGMIANIPLSIFFAKTMNMGLSGVILGTILSLSLFSIVGPLVTYSIISRKNESIN